MIQHRPKADHKISKRLRIATLNIRTVTGRSQELSEILKRRNIDIACIQETRWKGQKSRDVGEGYKLIYNGVTNTKDTAVIVNEKLRSCVAEVYWCSDHLMSVTIDLTVQHLRVISPYAPQVDCEDEEKDKFWVEIQDHVSTCSQDYLWYS